MNPTNSEAKRLAKGRRRRRGGGAAMLIWLVLALAAGFFAAGRVALSVTVQGNSMSPTLENGQVALCLRNDAPGLNAPQRGEMVLLGYEGALLVKRVIALGGDTVDIDEDGAISVNGEMLTETYIAAPGGESDVVYPLTVPEGELFVMGDHRAFAVDSRSRVFGTVPAQSVAGRPVAIVWPVYDLKWLGWPGRDASAGYALGEASE